MSSPVVPLPILVSHSPPYHFESRNPPIFFSPPLAEISEVKKLWSCPQNNMIVSSLQSGALLLRHSSFCTLGAKEWVDGSVIDFFIHLLARDTDVYVLDTFLVGCILEENNSVLKRNMLKNVNFARYKALIGGYNLNRNHWNLLYIHLPTKTMFLVEPFQNCITDVIAKFRNYLKIRNN
ncbi:uncharacterized protein LOC104266586 [Ciona intestinalis]